VIKRGILAAGVIALALVTKADASACGMFVPPISDLMKTLPKLAVEQVLIVHDADTKMEHFIREIRVDRGSSNFGFVVPMPSKPEVARVAKEPFKALRDKFPFYDPNAHSKGGPPGGGAMAAGAAPPGVTVLSEQQIGNFKTYVLSATSGGGLEQWLKENNFAAPPITRGWIDHYVRNEFFFVAFRYDAPKDAPTTGITGETVRISFSTPVPYYPYIEPRHEARPEGSRALAVWLATKDHMHPIASMSRMDGTTSITRAWMSGAAYEKSRAKLASAIGPDLAKLLPKGELTVATFQDLRVDRSGIGDVLFAPDKPVAVDDAFKKERARFIALLDPTLEPGDAVQPVSVIDGYRGDR
jgi:hypothetical protein